MKKYIDYIQENLIFNLAISDYMAIEYLSNELDAINWFRENREKSTFFGTKYEDAESLINLIKTTIQLKSNKTIK